MHLLKYAVAAGTSVKAGDLVAYTDNTGTSTTAAHLHYELLIDGVAADPIAYIKTITKCGATTPATTSADDPTTPSGTDEDGDV